MPCGGCPSFLNQHPHELGWFFQTGPWVRRNTHKEKAMKIKTKVRAGPRLSPPPT